MGKKDAIFKGTFVLVAYYLIAKVMSFLIEMMIASKFGASKETDAYYLVDGIILATTPLLAVGLWKIYMPQYKTHVVLNQLDKANILTDDLIILFFLLSSALGALIFAFPIGFIKLFAPGFEEESLAMSVRFLRILVFLIPVGIITIFPSAILQSRSLFSKSQLKEIVVFVPPLAYLLLWADKFGVEGLAASLLLGYILAFVSQYAIVSPYYKFHFRKHIIDKDTLSLLKVFPVACLNAVLSQIHNVVDKMFASTLAIGAISYLNYGGKFFHLFNGAFSTAVSVAVFPHLTEMLAKEDYAKFEAFFKKYILIVCGVLLPVSAMVALFSHDIISLFFGHGKFTYESVSETSKVLLMYGLGLFPMGLITMLDDVFYIKKRMKVILFTTIANIFCNITLDYLLISKYQVSGLSLATTLSLYVSLILKGYFIRDLFSVDKDFTMNIGVALFACAISGMLVYSMALVLPNCTILLRLLIGAGVFILSYAWILYHNGFYKMQINELLIILKKNGITKRH